MTVRETVSRSQVVVAPTSSETAQIYASTEPEKRVRTQQVSLRCSGSKWCFGSLWVQIHFPPALWHTTTRFIKGNWSGFGPL